ncbi:MAG: hypothetical protein JRF50_16125 [Deltaproteobacteria bacterium]|nr:hypothetical protein [Deltaproteobacteria bacterium]
MGKDTHKGGSQEHSSNTIDLLVTKGMYPMFSTKGKIFFKRSSPTRLSDKEAMMKSTSAIILVHNHPSDEPDPIQDDINITNQIARACNLVGIEVLAGGSGPGA